MRSRLLLRFCKIPYIIQGVIRKSEFNGNSRFFALAFRQKNGVLKIRYFYCTVKQAKFIAIFKRMAFICFVCLFAFFTCLSYCCMQHFFSYMLFNVACTLTYAAQFHMSFLLVCVALIQQYNAVSQKLGSNRGPFLCQAITIPRRRKLQLNDRTVQVLYYLNL